MSRIRLLLCALIVSLILLAIFFTKYLMLKKQIRNLSGQMVNLMNETSEKMLDISLIDRDLERLTGVLNQYHAKQRYMVARAMRHEEHLKDSIANISHDLRTPLTVILGHLQLLLKQELTKEQDQRVQIVRRKAEKMKELVGNFYDLSVLDSNQITLSEERFNLSNLLIDLLTENAPAMEKGNIQPEITLPDHSVFIFSDRSMTERIFQNLLTNALRYSAGEIKISLSPLEKGCITFCIENTVQDGVKLDVERMFERFYTGDRSRHSEGTGLGLAVVKLLVEKLGGQISAVFQANVLTVNVAFKDLSRGK